MILTATINEVKRRVTFDNPNAVVAVKGDYEVNGVAFAFPAIYEDDFDLSTAVKTVYYKATDGIIYNHIVTDTDTDTGYPLWVFKDEINKGAFGDVEFALVCDKVENGNIVKRWVSMITAFRVQKSIEIDESEQEDNEQTYSERLAYLMTQMANMQATVSGLASGAPTPVSLASAMTDTSKLYVYTGSESGYTAGHWYYYNGSAWADGGPYGGISVDPTLTVSGAAADAKVVGDEIDEIKEDLSALDSKLIITNYTQGSLSYSDGWQLDGANRLRSTGFSVFSTGVIIVQIASGYKYAIREYRSPEFAKQPTIASYVGSLTGDIFKTGNAQYEVNTDHYYRFVVAKTDDSAITPSEGINANLTIITPCSEAIVPKNNYAVANGSLLGNVSIRAAKTFNFSDGTPPMIEWYLLQDTNSRFYSSKDLTSKKYLFTFFAPSSNIANWSCGIDANNNIFFLKDAAGYTDSDGPRLDDAKRENPVYFLASENYKTMHTLDFGSNFKPAGWLSNVGWCVLPNNDIIMCEYTRGTLATCNVWHVSADATIDPSGWTRTWSHAIVDSTSGSEPEMKHCHCVQYDFYTGICYFSTGDGVNSSYIYCSTDNGVTWTLAHGPDRSKCRQLNFVFTKNKVYWASDNYEAADHNFYIANRLDSGVIDVVNAQVIPIGFVNNQACYGCCYIRNINTIVFVDRNDNGTYSKFILMGYDLDTDAVVTIGEWSMINGYRGGFRCKFIDWNPTSNYLRVGFNTRTGGVTDDTNVNALCGNLGGKTGPGTDRINNLTIYINKHGTQYDYRASTTYV